MCAQRPSCGREKRIGSAVAFSLVLVCDLDHAGDAGDAACPKGNARDVRERRLMGKGEGCDLAAGECGGQPSPSLESLGRLGLAQVGRCVVDLSA
jgi:hypothetical protein